MQYIDVEELRRDAQRMASLSDKQRAIFDETKGLLAGLSEDLYGLDIKNNLQCLNSLGSDIERYCKAMGDLSAKMAGIIKAIDEPKYVDCHVLKGRIY